MIFRHTYQNGVWIDLEHPTQDDIRKIAEEFPISERIQAEILSPTPAPLVASDTDATFLVLHFPAEGSTDGEMHSQEVDFIVGDRFLITARYEVVAPLHHLQKLLEAQELISPTDAMSTPVLLEILFAHIYTAVRDHAATTAERLGHIERDMLNGLERESIRAISSISREFLHIEATLANHEEPLDRFLKTVQARGIFGPSFPERIGRIQADRTLVARLVRTYRAVATELRETNAALLDAHQNEIMKTLTLITVFVLPLEFTAVLFGVRAPGTPFVNDPHAFWILAAFLVGIAGFMAILFARKRWF